MAKLLKLRRGTTSQHSSFTGAEGEVTVDTTKDTVVVHDGSTAGGHPLAKESAALSLIDEDNMATDSATRPPSQQSVKAYVDAHTDSSKMPLAGGTFTGDVIFDGATANYDITWDKSANNIIFNDQVKAVFGTGSDGLEVYHDAIGGHSRIKDSGTGGIIISSNEINIQNAADSETIAHFIEDGAVSLYYNHGVKIATTNTGINVTGTAELDGITIDGQYIQQEETLTVSSNATTVDCSTGNYFTVQAAGDITFTFGTPPADTKSYAMVIEVDHNSGTLTWPASVKWNGDTAPTLTTGKTHQFYFHTNNGGTRWRGAALVDYVD